MGWTWSSADQYAPASTLFAVRGTAQVLFRVQYAAPGDPAALYSQYGVIRYRDNLESFRNYDLFFSPSLAVWKFRYEPDGTTTWRYIGGFHYDNCQDGFVTATDRVLMPAIGTTIATECGSPVTSVKTNYWCVPTSRIRSRSTITRARERQRGSAHDRQPPRLERSRPDAVFRHAARTLDLLRRRARPEQPVLPAGFSLLSGSHLHPAAGECGPQQPAIGKPDPHLSRRHDHADASMDGSGERPWLGATDGYWMAPDSAPNGTVYYYNASSNQYVQPFANGQNPSGLYLTSGNGWVGHFIDQIRPSFGMGFYYYPPGGIGIFPSNNWPSSPSVLHTDYSTGLCAFGQVFRQMFITIGTKEEMQGKLATVKDYVFVFDTASPPPNGHQITIRPASAGRRHPALTGTVDTSTTFAKWGKYGGAGYVQVGIHTLPCGLAATDVQQAALRMPRTDNIWTADTSSLNLNMLLQHIAASSNASVTLPDGSSTPLGSLGTYRCPAPTFWTTGVRWMLM